MPATSSACRSFPGVATASEIERARVLGRHVVKVFPGRAGRRAWLSPGGLGDLSGRRLHSHRRRRRVERGRLPRRSLGRRVRRQLARAARGRPRGALRRDRAARARGERPVSSLADPASRRRVPLGSRLARRGDAAARPGRGADRDDTVVSGVGGGRRVQRRPRPQALLRSSHRDRDGARRQSRSVG